MKKLLCVALVAVFIFAFVGCIGEKKPVGTDFATPLKEVFDVDESFDFARVKGVLFYEDGSSEQYAVKAEDLVGFDTATTGEKTAKLVKNGVEKTFSYLVEYAAVPTKKILTTARVRLEKAASLNGAARVLKMETGDLSGVVALSCTVECTSPFDQTFEQLPLLEGWDVRVKTYSSSSSAKILLFRRGGAVAAGSVELLSLSTVGDEEAEFSLKDVVVSDGEANFDLPNVPRI